MSKILNILLQRNDSQYPWGFTVVGKPGSLFIDKVSPGALASQHLSVGDKILQLAGIESERLEVWQAQDLVQNPARSLELVVLKGGGQTTTSRKYSDGSESATSSSNSNLWQRRCRPGSSASIDARKAKQQFWERCSALQSRDFHGSVESELFRSKGRHSRSHSLERGGSATPISFSSTSDIYHSSALSEPVWGLKTGSKNTGCHWDRTQSCMDDKTFFSENDETQERMESSQEKLRNRNNINENLENDFKESVPNKPGKFPWFDGEEDITSNISMKRKEFSNEYTINRRSSSETYNKKETNVYEREESSSKFSDSDSKYIKEEEKSYVYHKSGFVEENSSFSENRTRSHTPAGFYENHREEFKSEERSITDKMRKSVEKEEKSSRSYIRESTADKSEDSSSTQKEESLDNENVRSESRLSDTQSELSNVTNFTDSRLYSNIPADEVTIKTQISSEQDVELPEIKQDFSNYESQNILKSNDICSPPYKEENQQDRNNLSADWFTKRIANNDRPNIFDARKYWSCTSPTSVSKFVFVPEKSEEKTEQGQVEHIEKDLTSSQISEEWNSKEDINRWPFRPLRGHPQ